MCTGKTGILMRFCQEKTTTTTKPGRHLSLLQRGNSHLCEPVLTLSTSLHHTAHPATGFPHRFTSSNPPTSVGIPHPVSPTDQDQQYSKVTPALRSWGDNPTNQCAQFHQMILLAGCTESKLTTFTPIAVAERLTAAA